MAFFFMFFTLKNVFFSKIDTRTYCSVWVGFFYKSKSWQGPPVRRRRRRHYCRPTINPMAATPDLKTFHSRCCWSVVFDAPPAFLWPFSPNPLGLLAKPLRGLGRPVNYHTPHPWFLFNKGEICPPMFAQNEWKSFQKKSNRFTSCRLKDFPSTATSKKKEIGPVDLEKKWVELSGMSQKCKISPQTQSQKK